MKKTFAIVIPLLMCLAHTTGLCFVSHSPQILETRNWQLETEEGSSKVLKFEISKVADASYSPETLCASASLCEKIGEQVFRAYYDNSGNVTNKIDGNGISICSTYDALDRLTAVFTNDTANTQRMRPAPASYNNPLNTGGAMEILPQNPNNVQLLWFHMP